MKILEINQNLKTNEAIKLRKKRSIREEALIYEKNVHDIVESNMIVTNLARNLIDSIYSNTTKQNNDQIEYDLNAHIRNIQGSTQMVDVMGAEISFVCSTILKTGSEKLEEMKNETNLLIQELIAIRNSVKNKTFLPPISTIQRNFSGSIKEEDSNIFSNENLNPTQSNINTNFSVANKTLTLDSSISEKKNDLDFLTTEKGLSTDLTEDLTKEKIEIKENKDVKLASYNESNSFSLKNIPSEMVIMFIMFCLIIIISLSICCLLCFNNKKEEGVRKKGGGNKI